MRMYYRKGNIALNCTGNYLPESLSGIISLLPRTLAIHIRRSLNGLLFFISSCLVFVDFMSIF
jgi:hypothetical protein